MPGPTFVPSEFSSYGGDVVDMKGNTIKTMDDFGLLIAEENEGNSIAAIGGMLAGGVAAAYSYKRSKSIPWAFLAWVGWPIALPYMYMIPKD